MYSFPVSFSGCLVKQAIDQSTGRDRFLFLDGTYTFMHFVLFILLFGKKKDVKTFSVSVFALPVLLLECYLFG